MHRFSVKISWNLCQVVGLAVVLPMLVGCTKSEPMGSVEGKVALNGQPFSNARLNFASKQMGTAAAADIQTDGTYAIGAPLKVGEYTVYLVPKTMADPDHPKAGSGIDPKVPAKYWSEASSDIKVAVKAGKNQAPIELRP